jgi:uncharacterized protein YcfJ
MGQGAYPSGSGGYPAKQTATPYDFDCWLKCVAIKEASCVPFRVAGAAIGAVGTSVVTGPPTFGASVPAAIVWGGSAGNWAGRAVCEIVSEDCRKKCEIKQCPAPTTPITINPNADSGGYGIPTF